MARVVLVHGAWHGGWCWESLTPLLEKAGHAVEVVDLPSVGSGGDLAADAAVVRDVIERSADPTVVVGHSYGGQVISEGAAGIAQVSHLVYLCAFMLDEGESLLGALNNEVPPWIQVDDESGNSVVPDPVPVFYADVEVDLARSFAGQVGPQSLKSFADPLTQVAWKDTPSTYVACTQDQAIPYPAQQAMSARAGSVTTLDSSHSPFVSHADEVAAVINGVAGG